MVVWCGGDGVVVMVWWYGVVIWWCGMVVWCGGMVWCEVSGSSGSVILIVSWW